MNHAQLSPVVNSQIEINATWLTVRSLMSMLGLEQTVRKTGQLLAVLNGSSIEKMCDATVTGKFRLTTDIEHSRMPTQNRHRAVAVRSMVHVFTK
jgi:hypothetical protein